MKNNKSSINQKHMRKIILILIFCLILTNIKTYSQTKVGTWREHLPFSHATCVAEVENKIFCASEAGLFFYNKSDNAIETITKNNGLSDNLISTINYSKSFKTLVVAYANGNIDLLSDKSIYNISDIKRKDIIGTKKINGILFINNYAYLSCDFGIVVLDIDKKEIKDTYFIGEGGSSVKVFDMTFDGSYLYAATQNGLYQADINSPNLLNYQNWHRFTNLPTYDKSFNTITIFDNKIFANYSGSQANSDTIYVYDGVDWNYYDTTITKTKSLSQSYDNLIIVENWHVNVFNKLHERIRHFSTPESKYAILDKDNILWVADYQEGLIQNAETWHKQKICPNGPIDSKVFDIEIVNNNLWVASGGRTSAWGNIYNSALAHSFINENWESFSEKTIPEIEELRDIVNIAINPNKSNNVFFGTWGNGIIEFSNNLFKKIYNEDNTNEALQNISNQTPNSYVRIGGMTFDNDNNLWITNSSVENPIVVKKANGEWLNYNFQNKISNIDIGKIIVAQNADKWVVLPRGNGLFIFNTNNTFDNLSDDTYKRISLLNDKGKIISNDVYSIAEDLDGEIWIGTNAGVVVYYNPQNILSNNSFYATQPILEVDGISNYLLLTETVSAIAVDGANRKWFGTQNGGAFLVSDDGGKQILNFNVDNSPLPSNNITSISINHNTGEVFFGTSLGIVSYKSSATRGSSDFSGVYVYPNPVKPNYNGLITIKGLVADVNVKITDISGNIVYETDANGGEAVWNGKNFSGKKVHTGVYIVFCTNEDGSKSFITKLLFVN
ncbi:MAG: T9SS type A sorting domain-containing protein [Bacteroidetes bacterium]|nr:T9SS type A sorting domain-containing protein [Bacteroidota bacterium]